MTTVSGLSGTYAPQGVLQQATVSAYNYTGGPAVTTRRKLEFDFTNGDGDLVHATFEITSTGVETGHLYPAEPGNLTVTVDVTPEE